MIDLAQEMDFDYPKFPLLTIRFVRVAKRILTNRSWTKPLAEYRIFGAMGKE